MPAIPVVRGPRLSRIRHITRAFTVGMIVFMSHSKQPFQSVPEGWTMTMLLLMQWQLNQRLPVVINDHLNSHVHVYALSNAVVRGQYHSSHNKPAAEQLYYIVQYRGDLLGMRRLDCGNVGVSWMGSNIGGNSDCLIDSGPGSVHMRRLAFLRNRCQCLRRFRADRARDESLHNVMVSSLSATYCVATG